MNQEIIEQAAASYADSIPQFDDRRRYCREDFIAGAKWIAEHLGEVFEQEMIKIETDNTLRLAQK